MHAMVTFRTSAFISISTIQIPRDEIYVQNSDESEDNSAEDIEIDQFMAARRASRRRAKSINPMALSQERHEIDSIIRQEVAKERSLRIPTVFRYNYKNNNAASNTAVPSQVYISGSMTEWRSKKMASLQEESHFLAVIECLPGKVHFKFCVDGTWTHDESQPFLISKSNQAIANFMTVKPEDREVFEALACDSFVAKIRKSSSTTFSDQWSQTKPTNLNGYYQHMHPPFLPPHLSAQNVLNKTE